MSITDNIDAVDSRIRSACQAVGRAPSDVRLLAVSKTRTHEDVEAAMVAGQVDFGENYLQDALSKVERLAATWHFIGAIQSNKTRLIAENFSWVHTLSSVKVAKRLDTQRPDHLPVLNTLLQVNIDNDPAKSGLSVDDVSGFLAGTRDLGRLRICGLMTIPARAQADQITDIRAPFARLRELRDSLRSDYPDLTHLSMGMSEDLEAAIAEGATWVRIGTAIFGART